MKFYKGKKITRCMRMLLLLLLITESGIAQDYNVYQASDAVMLQEGGDIHIETRLKKAIIALSNNSNQLKLRIFFPYHSINYIHKITPLSIAAIHFYFK